jgi:uncharacterized protein (TIRG00374 family)
MKWIRWALSLITFTIVLYLFWPLIGELRAAADLFRQAHWGWLATAALTQVVSYGFLAWLNYLLLLPFQGKISFWLLMAILPAMAFIQVAIPSAGASGIVLRARFLGRSGYTAEASTFTLALESIYLTAVMIGMALAGLGYLIRSGELNTSQLAILSGVAFLVLVVGILIYWAGRERRRAKRWAGWLVGQWNGLAPRFRQSPYPLEDLYTRIDGFYDGLKQLGQAPRWPFLVMTLGRVALDVASLGACFLAFGYNVPPGVLLTGYGLMLLLSTLSALPGGLGLADASLAVIYARLGAPGAVAVAAALAYRLIAFWLLRFIGFINWQILEAKT